MRIGRRISASAVFQSSFAPKAHKVKSQDMLRALVPSPLFDSLVNPLSVELLKLENVLPTRTVDFALNYEYPHLKPDSPDRILETLPSLHEMLKAQTHRNARLGTGLELNFCSLEMY
ncbi:hypothetical protein M9H77_36722 [Catharanthus roseus]|uniref:Uncharacterized protein n=1 Tax=Catharanthus roseus TaxID=4058 RepID=A0ACB9ZWW8_CATRO|nr:hypothetical protein M9H77_36722 [Catharanthus roseus]